MTVPGTCALCLSSGVILQVSHIVPAWVNRKLREKTAKSGDPVTVARGKAIQTSKQETEHMLCVDCEQIIGRWERYVARLASHEDGTPHTFPRLPLPEQLGTKTTANVELADLSSMDVDQIVRFAASVIWRADTAATLQGRGSALGPYAEALRGFLNGDRPSPANVTILMAVLDPNLGENDGRARGFCQMAAFPVSTNNGLFHSHMFGVCGLYFQILIGNKIPGQLRALCLAHGRQDVALVLYPPDIELFRRAERLFKAASPKGKLMLRGPKEP